MSRVAWLLARLPTGSEEETARDGVLSSRAEVHALVIGFLAGVLFVVTGDVGVVAGFWTVMFGGRALAGHLADARKELAYTSTGFLLAMGGGVVV